MDPKLVTAWTDAEAALRLWLTDYVSAGWSESGEPIPMPAKVLDRAALERYEELSAALDEAHLAYRAAWEAESA